MTLEERLKSVHNNYYTYEGVELTNAVQADKINITCPQHGVFASTIKNHLKGRGCPECGREKTRRGKIEYARKRFFETAPVVHKGFYTYHPEEYVSSSEKTPITCPVHGVFMQAPAIHIRGVGCPRCGSVKAGLAIRKTMEEFLAEARAIHGNKYDYPETIQTTSDKLRIVCPTHGDFWQLPLGHLRSKGCPKCAMSGVNEDTYEEFVTKARLRFGDRFEYRESAEPGMVDVYLEGFGWQVQERSAHLHRLSEGYRFSRKGTNLKYTTDSWVELARSVHGDTYDYSRSEYTGIQKDVVIICRKHGEFRQWAEHHTHLGCGCPSCRSPISRVHQEVIDMLEGEIFVVNDREVISPLEIDLYLPDHKLAIEVNGLWYHSARYKTKDYHITKYELLRDKGIKLIQFWDYQIRDHPDLVRSMIFHHLGKSRRIFARKTEVVELDSTTYKAFLENNHIQGAVNSGIRLGLSYEGEIVAVMGLSRIRNEVNLQRFCNAQGVSVVGGPSRLLRQVRERPVVSFSDSFYSDGGVYRTLGFRHDGENPPRLHYTDGLNLVNRRNLQKPTLRKNHPNLDYTKTEKILARELGFEQIFGGKTTRWVLD